MFDQTFVNTHAYARRPWTVAASLTLQTGLVALAIIVPVLHPDLLRPTFLEMPVYLPMRVTPPPPVPVITEAQRGGPITAPRRFDERFLVVPTRVPVHAGSFADDAPDLPFTGSAAGSQLAGIPGGVALPDQTPALPERPVAQVKPIVPPAGPVRVSTGVQAALLTFGPKPVYPQLAKAARVQGTVRITAVIAADGGIKNLQVLGGPPLLVKAALDAVHQWRYRPTMLSGGAVEVITEIDVNFTLSQ